MPVIIACPNCQTKLKVPEAALGKKVKCSKCATAFTAEEQEAAAGPTEVRERPAAPTAARRRAAPPPDEELEDDEEQEEEDEEDEEEEDRPRRRRRRRRQPDAVETLIPYRNGRALAAYYCGVFSFIPCVGLILGPIALIFGILGLRFAKAHPTARGGGHAIAGIVMGSLTTLGYWGLTIIGIIGMAMSAGRH
jgi:predicted Zn finger-like uncharacterized protein